MLLENNIQFSEQIISESRDTIRIIDELIFLGNKLPPNQDVDETRNLFEAERARAEKNIADTLDVISDLKLQLANALERLNQITNQPVDSTQPSSPTLTASPPPYTPSSTYPPPTPS